MKLRKILAVLLSVFLLAACVPYGIVCVSAATRTGTTGDCTWTLDENDNLTISGNGAMGDYGIRYADGGSLPYTTAPWGMFIGSVVIESGVTSIGKYAFYGCRVLSEITLSDTVTTIEEYAFDLCSYLDMVTIPAGVTTIGERAFFGPAFDVDENNACYSSVDGVLFDKSKTTLVLVPSGITTYVVPDGITTIGDYAFSSCALKSVTIPSSVNRIGKDAFPERWLYDVHYNGTVKQAAAISIESENTALSEANWHFSDGVVGNWGITGDCVWLVGGNLFDGHLTIWGDGAMGDDNAWLKYFTGYGSVTIEEGVTTIGKKAFAYMEGLTSLTIPDGVTTIGDEAFYWCWSMDTLVIPASVHTIGDGAFSTCDALTDVYYTGSEADRAKISIGLYNERLLNATWHYNYVPEQPAPGYGDADGDGVINNRDLALFQQYLSGWDMSMDEGAADCNGDGEVNNLDLALVQQYLSGWDVIFGK